MASGTHRDAEIVVLEYCQERRLPVPEFSYKSHEEMFTCIVTLTLPSQQMVLADFDAWHMRKKTAKTAAAQSAIQWLGRYGLLPHRLSMLCEVQSDRESGRGMST